MFTRRYCVCVTFAAFPELSASILQRPETRHVLQLVTSPERYAQLYQAMRSSSVRYSAASARPHHATPRRRGPPSRMLRCSSSTFDQAAVADTGGDGGTPPPSSKGYGGNGDGNGGGNDHRSEISLLLTAASRRLESLPPDMQAAFTAGNLYPSALKRFLELESNWFCKLFLPFQGFRERLMADPSFFVKVGIECGIGIGTKCAAESRKRGDAFKSELDFVTANVIMAIIADFMLVWLPAPTMSFTSANSCRTPANALARFFSCCPENAFQKVPKGFPPWSLAQRAAAPVRNGAKLLGVGFAASMLGVGITNGLIACRKLMNPDYPDSGQAQNPLVVSSAYAAYMASSSNIRYQVVAGVVEERGIETLFAGNHTLCHALSFVLRTANTYLGSLLWVDFIRLLGLQPKAGEPKA
eukprot:jgi/Ulvmu1/809/UM010_0183.1